MTNSNRVIFNTLVLYAKMGITMIISLYSVRLVLASLGTVDYGIFNVIMGVVSMLSFLNAALTVSTQRYLSFYQGKKDFTKLIKIFNHSFYLHAVLGLGLVLLLELFGGYILNHYLTIPADRMDTAQIVFHLASLAIFFTFISVPYTASINANERMIFIALVTILESVEKLLLAIYLTYMKGDCLLVYGIGMGLITVLSFVMYFIICMSRFDECKHFTLRGIDGRLLKELGGFASWNLVGSITAMSKNQGLSVLFNIFRGPAVNAAYAVANQVSAQLNFFSMTMMRSINPQIMKSEGAGDHERMLKLSSIACKYGFLLLAFFSIPCIFEMPKILQLWLKDVPQYSSNFCVMILLAMLFDQLTVGIHSAFQACKFVKESSIYVGAVKLLILPLGYLLLKQGWSVYYVVGIYALVELTAGVVRIILAKVLMDYSILYYIRNVICRILLPVVLTCAICLLVTVMTDAPYRIVVTLLVSAITFTVSSYYLALPSAERSYFRVLIKEKVLRHG